MGNEGSSGGGSSGGESSGGNSGGGALNEKGVSNISSHRSVSNALDKHYFDNHPKQRAYVHEQYHNGMGYAKSFVGNKEGAQSEFARAAEQRDAFNKADSPR